MSRKVIEASEGMILTNGKIFGTKIYLAEGVDDAEFREITLGEYENIQAEGEANIEDYKEALARFGVNENG